MCQVSLGLKEVQMGVHDFKYNKVSFFDRKTGNINTSMYVPSFIRIEIGSDGGP